MFIEGKSLTGEKESWAINSDDYVIVYQSLNSSLACHVFAFLDIVAIAGYSYFALSLQPHRSKVGQNCHFRLKHLGVVYVERKQPVS